MLESRSTETPEKRAPSNYEGGIVGKEGVEECLSLRRLGVVGVLHRDIVPQRSPMRNGRGHLEVVNNVSLAGRQAFGRALA